MKVLIVHRRPDRGTSWRAHFDAQGASGIYVRRQNSAVALLSVMEVDLIILDIGLDEGSALAVADYAQYRHPATPLIIVSDSIAFSDGSIFAFIKNVRATITSQTSLKDLWTMAEHFTGQQAPPLRPGYEVLQNLEPDLSG